MHVDSHEALPPPPYPGRDPVPSSLRDSMKYLLLEFRTFNLGESYPYRLSPLVEKDKRKKDTKVKEGGAPSGERETSLLESSLGNDADGPMRRVWTPCCAVLYGPHDPVVDDNDPGDVWINIGPSKSVWVLSLRREWVQWPGNKATRSLPHPWFPSLYLWCAGETWSWSQSVSIASYAQRWRQGRSPGGKWMKAKQRTFPSLKDPGGIAADLGNAVDAVEQWLEKNNTLIKLETKNDLARPLDPDPLIRAVDTVDVIQDSIQPPIHPAMGDKRRADTDHGQSQKRARHGVDQHEVLAGDIHAFDPDNINIPPSPLSPALSSSALFHPAELPISQETPALSSAAGASSVNEYQLLPADCCIAGKDGIEWPVGASTLTWPNGIETVLPFVTTAKSRANIDADAVKNMARSRLVPIHEGDDDSPVTIIRLKKPDFSQLSGLTCQSTDIEEQDRVSGGIKHALSEGKPAVIMGWKPDGPRVGFDEAGLEPLQGTLDLDVQWQCARKRDADRYKKKPTRDIHRDSTLRSFIRLATDQTECGNVLDVPDANGEVPWFIRLVSDDMAALKVTEKVGFSQKALKAAATSFTDVDPSASSMKKSQKSQAAGAVLKPQLKPLTRAEEREKMTRDALKANMGDSADHHGPQLVNFDSFKLRNWSLITMRGFYTFPHHDANGYATWVSMRCGAKWWGFRRFRAEHLEDASNADMVELFDKMCSGDSTIIGYETNDGYIMFLHEALVLVMPPGMIHEVYTPCNTIAIGGHFLSYETLHLTQWTRYVDHAIQSSLTNADHHSVLRSLCRMVIALRYQRIRIRTRAFLALSDMIIRPEDYFSQKQKHAYDLFAWEDLEEWKEARRIVKVVMDKNTLTADEVRRRSLVPGRGWDRCENTYIDFACIHTS